MINKKILLRSAVVTAVLAPSVSFASGYKINEQSAAGMGTAHAGRAAMAEDASVVFYNPAAMTELDRAQFTGGFTYISADGEFEGQGTDIAGNPITGGDDTDPYSDGGDYLGEAFIPFLYYVQPINEQLSFGLAQQCVKQVHHLLSDTAIVNSDIAILVRSGAEAELIRSHLGRAGLSASYEAKSSIFETSEALAIYYLLQAVAEPKNEFLLRRCLAEPFFGLKDDQFNQLNQQAHFQKTPIPLLPL